MSSTEHYNLIEQEVLRHLEDTETSKLGHWSAAKRLKFCQLWFFDILVPVSIALLAVIATDCFEVLSSEQTKYWKLGLGLFAAIWSTANSTMSLKGLIQRHVNAASKYHALWRHCKNWKSDFPDETNIEQAIQTVKNYRNELNDINQESPQIPKWAWKIVKKSKAEGSTTYKNEEKLTK